MGALKIYDPKEVTITWMGKPLNSGIVDGTFITVSRSNRNSSLNTGADGRSTLVVNNNRTGAIKLTLRAGSETNAWLSDKVKEDEATPLDRNIGMLQIQDFSGASLHADSQAFLNGPPDGENGTDESDLEWTWECPNISIDFRGNNEA